MYIKLRKVFVHTSLNHPVNNSQICQKDKVKYLGVVIDKNLKWKPHIYELTTHLSKSVECCII